MITDSYFGAGGTNPSDGTPVRERDLLGEASYERGFVGRCRRAGSSAAVAAATASKVGLA